MNPHEIPETIIGCCTIIIHLLIRKIAVRVNKHVYASHDVIHSHCTAINGKRILRAFE